VLRVERPSDGVALLTLDRPEKRNALSIELRLALAEALSDTDARVVVITGAPPAFCAGMDVTQFGGERDHRERLLAANDRFFEALLGCPAALVAAVNGAALGGGFAVALLCDVRFAGPDAVFGFPEVQRGVPASLGSALAALAPGLARDLCVTGRLVNAREAVSLGMARKGPLEDALACAREIAELPESAVGRGVTWGRQGPWREQLERERELLRSTLLG
jgi:enoyl-CoA hydratase